MMRDLSLTLQAILDDPALTTTFPELAAAQIVFDHPTETFNPTQTTIDLFLYDIRENMELRSNEPTIRRLNGQAEMRRPPLRIACSYLITAWPVGGSDLALQEHRLLSQVLQVLSRYAKIPESFLRGQLVGQEPLLPMMIAQAEGLKEPADFWTAIGNKLRPSLTVTVTIGMQVFAPVTAPLVITEEVRLGERTAPNEEVIALPTRQIFFRIGGRVTDASNAPVADVLVTLVGTGFTSQTGADGNYTLSSIPAGTYTLRVQSGATTREVTVTIPVPAGSHYNVQL
jgi:Pvc16 N-terminal domain/Carboxypeptidase regulatory-like domain